MSRLEALLDLLETKRQLTTEEYGELIRMLSRDDGNDGREELFARARRVREAVYGKKVYIRGLVEVSNVCRNDCYYCGIRKSNGHAVRYRMDQEEILACCREGYRLGFRTFVLQGGEDGYYTDQRLCGLLEELKRRFPDCAVTLSLGERTRESYERLFAAGADRYLLRHETADKTHYGQLHPPEMSWDNRMRCLEDLKEIGYQVGCGFMVGSPGQTAECLVKDMMFLQEFRPHMVGIGPFVPHHDTPFAKEPGGTVNQTLYLLSLIRILLPQVLLPATTALGTIDPMGREKGILAGANVLMPNLSPADVRGKYELYDNKLCTGDEAAESLRILRERIGQIGYDLTVDRGDSPMAE